MLKNQYNYSTSSLWSCELTEGGFILKTDERARVWTLVVYPESAPENWRDVLDSFHVPWVESPLHDKDKNADGTVKKSHWHVVLFFEGKKSFMQVKEITTALNGPIPKRVMSAKGIIRYLVHLDNPEKYQYQREQIKCHQGCEIESYFEESFSSRLETLSEMIEFIRDSQIENFMDFLSYCIDNDEKQWFNVAVNYNTMALQAAINGVYQKRHPKGDVFDELGDNVSKAKAMAKKGIKQREIADTLGVSVRTVVRYLKK